MFFSWLAVSLAALWPFFLSTQILNKIPTSSLQFTAKEQAERRTTQKSNLRSQRGDKPLQLLTSPWPTSHNPLLFVEDRGSLSSGQHHEAVAVFNRSHPRGSNTAPLLSGMQHFAHNVHLINGFQCTRSAFLFFTSTISKEPVVMVVYQHC